MFKELFSVQSTENEPDFLRNVLLFFLFFCAWENNVAKFNLILNEAQALTTNLQKNDEVLSMNFNW